MKFTVRDQRCVFLACAAPPLFFGLVPWPLREETWLASGFRAACISDFAANVLIYLLSWEVTPPPILINLAVASVHVSTCLFFAECGFGLAMKVLLLISEQVFTIAYVIVSRHGQLGWSIMCMQPMPIIMLACMDHVEQNLDGRRLMGGSQAGGNDEMLWVIPGAFTAAVIALSAVFPARERCQEVRQKLCALFSSPSGSSQIDISDIGATTETECVIKWKKVTLDIIRKGRVRVLTAWDEIPEQSKAHFSLPAPATSASAGDDEAIAVAEATKQTLKAVDDAQSERDQECGGFDGVVCFPGVMPAHNVGEELADLANPLGCSESRSYACDRGEALQLRKLSARDNNDDGSVLSGQPHTPPDTPECKPPGLSTVIVRALDGSVLLELSLATDPHLLSLPLRYKVCSELGYKPDGCKLILGTEEFGMDTTLLMLSLDLEKQLEFRVELDLIPTGERYSSTQFFKHVVVDSERCNSDDE